MSETTGRHTPYPRFEKEESATCQVDGVKALSVDLSGEELPADDLSGEDLTEVGLFGEELPADDLSGEDLPGVDLPQVASSEGARNSFAVAEPVDAAYGSVGSFSGHTPDSGSPRPADVSAAQVHQPYPERAYFDHAALTPLRQCAAEAMIEALSEYGNPSSVHATGRRARRRLEEAREKIASLLGADAPEVIFTGSGTEADNIAVIGTYRGRFPRRRILSSAVEHHSVLDVVAWLRNNEQAEVSLLEPDMDGIVSAASLKVALTHREEPTLGEELTRRAALTHRQPLKESLTGTAVASGSDIDSIALVAVMAVNNEVGTVQPVKEIAQQCAEYGIPLHVDGVAAAGHLPFDFHALGATTMSIASQKFGGPAGVGVLLARRDAPGGAVLFGGGQERGLRPGTQNIPGIIAMAVALSEAIEHREEESQREEALRSHLIEGIRRMVPTARINADLPIAQLGNALLVDPELTLEDQQLSVPSTVPGIVSVTFPDCEADSLLMLLDAQGVECSVGSACTSGVSRPSHVLLSMGVKEADARGTLRFSLGYTTTIAEINKLLTILPDAVERARIAGSAITTKPRAIHVLDSE